MELEKLLMKNMITETISLRKNDDYIEEPHPESSDLLPKSCALCERVMPSSTLLGMITFHAIAAWKQDHGVPIPPNDHRLKSHLLYNTVHICLFCNQFFDSDFGQAFEIEQAERQLSMKYLRGLPRLARADTTAPRPLSAITQSIEISALRMREMSLVGAAGRRGIGTSQSVAVLEIKAKTANCIHRVRLLLVLL